jgi:hypothetical protein
MTEEEKQEILSGLENIKPLDFKSMLPKSMRAEYELSELLNDFLLSFLTKRKSGQRKVDQYVLDKNGLDMDFFKFMSKTNTVSSGYAEIIKEKDDYVILKITEDGLRHYEYASKKYNTKSVTLIKRISLYVLKSMRQLWSFVFVSANNRIKTIMESGIIKLILFIMAILSFIMKDEINELIKNWWNK